MPQIGDLDEELLEQEEEAERREQESEEEKAERLEQVKQLQRMYEKEQPKDSGVQQALTQQVRKQATKQLAKQGKKLLARGLIELAAATSEFWVPALVIILLVVGVIGFIVFVPPVLCNSGGWTQFTTEIVGSIATFSNFCEPFKISMPDVTGPNTNTRSAPTDLVSLTGVVPIDGASNPFVRPCLLPFVVGYFDKIRSLGIDIVLTSAYRPGAITGTGNLSAHGSGEAFDVSLRNPSVPFFSNDPRIRILLSEAILLGFKPPDGDVLDEYNDPSRDLNGNIVATGPHVHIEFNAGYCDQQAVN